ncbi:MAG: ATP synthase F1 subunit delta [Bacteroidia bacterium]
MQQTKAGLRYAKSIFKLALDRNELDKVSNDMHLLNDTIVKNRELENLLESPIIKSDKKGDILHQIFDKHLGTTVLAFLDLLLKKRREMFVPQIARQFVLLYLENNNIEEATLVTAFPIDDDFRNKIKELILKNSSNASVELEEKIDPNLIGGFVLRFGDKQFDASVAGEIDKLRREFEKNYYVKSL